MHINFETLFTQVDAAPTAPGEAKVAAYSDQLIELIAAAKADGFSGYDVIETAFIRRGTALTRNDVEITPDGEVDIDADDDDVSDLTGITLTGAD